MLVEKNNLPVKVESLLRKGVEYVGIINERGKIEDSIFKNDLKLSNEKKEMFYMGLRLQHSMHRDYDDELGTISYAVTKRKNLKFVTIPILSYVILIVMDEAVRHAWIIDKIKKMIKNNNRRGCI
jgi:hypothetical protein